MLQKGFSSSKFGEEVIVIYQASDAWCSSMGLKEWMDICVAYLKNNWVNSCLNGTFSMFFGCASTPKSRVQRMAFHNMQKEDNKWVNPLLTLGK